MSASAAAEGSRRSRPSDELVLEFQECFAFFDRDRDGFLTSAEFCEAVRALGHAPTDAELAALQRTVDRIYSSSAYLRSSSAVLVYANSEAPF